MTYADMITLLICFFALLLAISVPKKEEMEKAKKEMQAQFSSTGAQRATPIVKPVSILDRGSSILPEIESGKDRDKGADPADPQPIKVDQEGDRIVTIEMDSSLFFGSGSATLSSEGQDVLKEVAARISDPKYRGYTIAVEGHTDDNPIATAQFPSNWELSASRAASVVHFFLQQGIDAKRLRAVGYADAAPKVENRDASGKPIPANQAANRRVVVKLEKINK